MSSSFRSLISDLGFWKPRRVVQIICCVLYAQSCLTFCDPMNCSLWALLSIKLSRQKYYSGLPFPPPGNLPDPGIEPTSPAFPGLQVDSLSTESLGRTHSYKPKYLISLAYLRQVLWLHWMVSWWFSKTEHRKSVCSNCAH